MLASLRDNIGRQGKSSSALTAAVAGDGGRAEALGDDDSDVAGYGADADAQVRAGGIECVRYQKKCRQPAFC